MPQKQSLALRSDHEETWYYFAVMTVEKEESLKFLCYLSHPVSPHATL